MRKSSLALTIGLVFLLLTIIIGLLIVSQAGQYGSYALAGGSLILMSGVLMGSLMSDRGEE
jgi:K+-transporting ATPase c subunit